MVRINSIALAGLAATGAFARPAKRTFDKDCMTDEEAAFVAKNYGTLIAAYTNELADATLAPNFTDYSESVNTLINTCPQGSAAISLPLLAPTFSSREQFEIGQGQQPPINFEQLNIWPSCQSVIIRWLTNNTAPIANPKPVVGLISMEVIRNTNASTKADYPWSIDTVYSEFDAGAWLQNLQEAGICGPAPGPCDSQQIPQEATPSTSAATAPATSVASPVASTPAASTPVASTPAASTPAVSASTPAGYGSSSASAPTPYASSAAAGYEAPTPSESYEATTTAVAVTTVTNTAVVYVNPDGSVSEEPCEEEK